MSSKSTFAPSTFAASTFAAGTFRGVGSAPAPPTFETGLTFEWRGEDPLGTFGGDDPLLPWRGNDPVGTWHGAGP